MSGVFARTVLLVLISLLTCPCNGGSSRDQTSSKQPIGTVLCGDGLASCPVHSSTCCLGKSNKYFCCPLPNAVCCADGIHCCPQCFSCNVKGGSCLRSATDAAAVRIFSLVPHIDKRIHTPPPIPPAAAAVALDAKRREVEENRASAYAAAVARKKAAEESESFVSGVLSAVKLTLFSNLQLLPSCKMPLSCMQLASVGASGSKLSTKPTYHFVDMHGSMNAEDSKAKKPDPLKVNPGLASPGSKLNSAPVGARPNVNLPQQPLKSSNVVSAAKHAGISKSSGILVHAASNQKAPVGKQPSKVPPQTTPTTQKPVQKPSAGQTVGGAKHAPPSQKKEEAAAPSSGFFSSVFSAVTDFYSGGNKEEPKSSDTINKAKPEQLKHQPKQQQQQQQQKPVQHQNLKQQQATIKQPVVQSRPIAKQMPSPQMAANLKFQAKPAVPLVNQQFKKAPAAAGQKVAVNQAAIKQQSAQALKKATPQPQPNQKQNVGITQKSAAAAISTQERKAKAWEAKPKKL